MNTVKIRKFTSEMIDECADLYMKTYAQEPWCESWESRDVVVDFYKNHINNNYFIGFVAEKDKRIVAISVGFAKPWIKGLEYYIDDFLVCPDHHRQGIGIAFMDAIKSELAAQNIHAIILNTERGYPAQKFYEKCGFESAESSIIMYSVF